MRFEHPSWLPGYSWTGTLLATSCLLFASAVLALVESGHRTHVMLPAYAIGIAWAMTPVLSRAWGGLRGSVAVLSPSGSGVLAALGLGLVVFLQSYRRHFWFGSGGKDLGLFHQSVWLLSRFEAPDNTVMGMNAFADHMEFIDVFAAPLQWIWPSAGALLLFQAALVGAGAWPLFELARRRFRSSGAGWAAVVAYGFGLDMQNAVMFDWNPTTCGAALLPWIPWALDRGHRLGFVIAVAAVALAKENLVLYAAGLCFVLALGSEDRARRRWCWWAVGALGAVFVFEVLVVFPTFRTGGFRHLRFAELGSTPRDILVTVLSDPVRAAELLVSHPRKVDGLLLPLSSVAWLLLLAPRYLIALLPIALERFWSDHANRWWGHHYGVGAGVIAVLGAIEGLRRLERWGPSGPARRTAVLGLTLSALSVSLLGHFGPGPLWVWRAPYYTTPQDRIDATRALAAVPPEASVAAQNHLLPHLSARRHIYEIRPPIEADYVALDFVQSAWPFGRDYPRRLARELRGRGYGVVACEGAAVVLSRGANSIPCSAF